VGRGTCARRVDHACAPLPRAGARRHDRASASLSRLRCRARTAIGPLPSSRLPLRSCFRSGNECACCLRSSPHQAFALCYPFTVHTACPLPWIISITVNIVVFNQTRVRSFHMCLVRESSSVFRCTQLLRVCDGSRVKNVRAYVFCSRFINSTATAVQRHPVQQ
jgi:hypothetical protein